MKPNILYDRSNIVGAEYMFKLVAWSFNLSTFPAANFPRCQAPPDKNEPNEVKDTYLTLNYNMYNVMGNFNVSEFIAFHGTTFS